MASEIAQNPQINHVMKSLINKNRQMNTKKKPSPRVFSALQPYQQLKKRHYNYYFSRQSFSISNDEFINAYTNVFNLINEMDIKMKQEKSYEKYQTTLLQQYRTDLVQFCAKCRELFMETKSMEPEDRQTYIFQLIQNYKRFMNWIFRIFRVIQKASLNVKGTYLCNEGLKILRTEFIEPIYGELFQLCFKLLDLFKNEKLKYYEPLQGIIKTIGVCGFSQHRYVTIRHYKQHGGGFEFASENKDTHATVQIPLETDYFKKNFTNQLVLRLQAFYRKTTAQLIQLSAPQYINRSLYFLKKEEQAADFFYPIKSVKDLIIRSIQEVVAHQRAQELLHKQNTGFRAMLDKRDIPNLSKLFQLMKRSSNLKLLGKEYQAYIDFKGNAILDKISAQDEKNAKREVVMVAVNQIYELYEGIERITHQISSGDIGLQTAQNFAFQQVCNKTNKLTNFLAYYADNLLRKDQNSFQNNTELITKVGKISKFLYSYDAFLKLYQKLLGLRIMYDSFKNRDTEYSIINMLKNEAGVSALNKISCMISDVKFSEVFNQQKMCYDGLKFGMQAMMLTSGSWQIQDHKNGRNLVPPQLMQAVQRFQEIYLEWMPGRVITWLFNYGRAIVQVRFNNSTHHLMLNNYQLLILLQLQREQFRKIKIMNLISDLKIDDENSFIASVLMLVKIGIVTKEGQPMKVDSRQEKIAFNADYKDRKAKVACFQVPRYVEKVNTQNVELIYERSHLIDAAIVKSMKSKRVMQFQELITQVQKLCRTFKADVGLIKKRIQNCQERDFLVRDENDMNCLIYKP